MDTDGAEARKTKAESGKSAVAEALADRAETKKPGHQAHGGVRRISGLAPRASSLASAPLPPDSGGPAGRGISNRHCATDEYAITNN
jgi:hypothetical protein